MNFNKAFTNELEYEGEKTRIMLSRVPFDRPDWAPHAKSTTVFNLARHVARTPEWITKIIGHDEVDVASSPFGPYPEIHSSEELTAYHDKIQAEAKAALEAASDDEFTQPFTMRMGDKVIFTMPKAAVLRNLAFNHTMHHRGQLSVYLRLLDVPVPGMYGPSADEQRPA